MGSRCNLMSRSVRTDPAGTQFAWSRRISHTLGLQNCTLLGLADPGIAQLDMACKHPQTLLPRCRWLFREGMHCSLIPHRLPMSTCPVCSFRMPSPRRAAQTKQSFHVFPPGTACILSHSRRRLRISLARTSRTRFARRCWRILKGRTCKCCLPCTFRRRKPRKTWRRLPSLYRLGRLYIVYCWTRTRTCWLRTLSSSCSKFRSDTRLRNRACSMSCRCRLA